MAVCYDRLWHILIDRHMSKTELIKAAGITTNAMAHLGRNEAVRVDVLAKICGALNCNIEDIVKVIPDEEVHTSGK
ncbi:MAG: helix-turn-helix transcriptional regulator [Eubacteriales bacterium]|nr:helix-turn-helix transcriptional regulator [Eubacteriales bacterium]